MTIFANAAVRRIAQGLCVVIAATGAAMAYSAGYNFIHDIHVTSGNRRLSRTIIREFFTPNRVPDRYTRVCLVNQGPRERAFTHSVTGINPLRAAPYGGRSCANFPSNLRVPFGLQDGSEPARSDVPMVMSLWAFKGGIVTFIWE